MPPAIEVKPVPTPFLAPLWPIVAPMLDRAIPTAPRLVTIEGVGRELGKEHARLWIARVAADENPTGIVGAAVTRPVQHECCRTINVWLVGGANLAAWWEAMDRAITDHARKHGCAYLDYAGRPGFKRRGKWHDVGVLTYREVA